MSLSHLGYLRDNNETFFISCNEFPIIDITCHTPLQRMLILLYQEKQFLVSNEVESECEFS